MQQALEVRIETLKKLAPVPKSLQMRFRYHGTEGSEMLPGDHKTDNLVRADGIITVRHIPRSMWDSNFGHTMERWRAFW